MNKKKYILISFVIILLVSLPVRGQEEAKHSGVGIRFSSFGIPDALLDLFLYEHPSISGSSLAFEVRSFGSEGPQSVFSGIFSMELSKMSGEGAYRADQSENQAIGSGEVTQISVSATILMSIFPSFIVHPYIGAGIGIGRLSYWYEGVYTDNLGTEIKDKAEGAYVIPIGHIPIGIMINIMDKFEVRLEGGFKNGFYFGGSAVYYF